MASIYQLPITDGGGTWSVTNGGNANQVGNINNNDFSPTNDIFYESSAAGVVNLDYDRGFPVFWNFMYLMFRNVASYKILTTTTTPFDTELVSVTTPPISLGLVAADSAFDTQFDLQQVELGAGEAQTFRLQILTRIETAQPVRVYKVLPMTHQMTFDPDDAMMDGFIEQTMDHERRTSYIREALDGTRVRSPLLYGYLKRSVSYTWTLGRPNINTRFADLVRILTQPFLQNFMFVQEFDRYPDRVFRAHIQDDRILNNYRSTFKGSGETFRFTIEEN